MQNQNKDETKKSKKRNIQDWQVRRQKEMLIFQETTGDLPKTERELNIFLKGATAEEQVKRRKQKQELEHAKTHLPAQPGCETCARAKIHRRAAKRVPKMMKNMQRKEAANYSISKSI